MRHGLLVYIAYGKLYVTAHFPFTLMFLPELGGMELAVPLAAIASIEPIRRLWGDVVRIKFHPSHLAPIELRLENEHGFIDALKDPGTQSRTTMVSKSQTLPPSHHFVAARWFFAIWGGLVLCGVSSELSEDYRFRRDGIETVGVFVGDTGGGRYSRGVLDYCVNAQHYHVTSIQGPGIYQLGGTQNLLYLPNRPDLARGTDSFVFDLIWLCAGIIALGGALFGERLLRRFKTLPNP